MSNQGHWVGLKANPRNFFGFIYVITDLDTGKAYVGRKQYWVKKRNVFGCKSAVSNRMSPKWKPKCWEESNWRTYRGSSKHFNKWMSEHPDHTYEYKIVAQYVSRGDLTYGELKELWAKDVLTETINGERKYFNRSIGAIKYIPTLEKIERLSEETIE